MALNYPLEFVIRKGQTTVHEGILTTRPSRRERTGSMMSQKNPSAEITGHGCKWCRMFFYMLLIESKRILYTVQKPRGSWFITVSGKIVGQIPSNFWKLFSSCLQVLNPLWLRFVRRSPSREQKEQQLVDTKLYAKREKWLVLVLHHWGLPVAYHSWDMINCGVQKQLARPLFQRQ